MNVVKISSAAASAASHWRLRAAAVLSTAAASAALGADNIAITPLTRSFGVDGGQGSIVTSGSGTWSASTSVSWITLLAGSSGTPPNPVSYQVAASSEVEQRVGYVYVSGNTHIVTQDGVGASLGNTSADYDSSGGTGSITVIASSGKSWKAKSNVDWITVASSSGSGSARINYTVKPYNDVSTRSGTLTVAGCTFTVNQTGRLMALTTTSATTDYFAEMIKIRVNALASTEWSVSSGVDWVTITDAGNGYGGDVVVIEVAENASYSARSTTVTIGTETFSVKQLGRTSLVFKLGESEFATGADGVTSKRVAVTATPDLNWSAKSSVDWVEFLSGLSSGSGNGTVGFKVKANPTLYARSGTITVTAADSGVSAKTITVSQEAATAALTMDGYTFEATGETVEVGVLTGSIVGWSIGNPCNWITITGATSTGPATLKLTAAINPSVYSRSGVVRIADHDFTVVQQGRGVAIEYESKVFDTDGRTEDSAAENIVTVTAEDDVEWTAVASDATWIVIYEGASGKGNGTVKYLVAPYIGDGTVRTGTIKIGDKEVVVSQRPYEADIYPTAAWVDGNAGAGEVQVSLDIDAVWDAILTDKSQGWVEVVVLSRDLSTGTGKVQIRYTENNTGKARSAVIVIAGEQYTLTQEARQTIAVAAETDGVGGSVSGAGVYELGKKATLTAVPDGGYRFVGWYDSEGACVTTGTTMSVIARVQVSYTAKFESLPLDLTVVNSSDGVTLGWTQLAWVDSYKIWRSESVDTASAKLVATLANDGTTQYTDKSGAVDTGYWYWVEAVSGNDDVFSNVVRGRRGEKFYTITYENLRGTSHANPLEYKKGDKITFAAPSARVGYTFAGWTPSSISATTAKDLVVTAKWTQNAYAVKFNANGGSGTMSDETFTYGFWKYLSENTFSRWSYKFAGWTTNAAEAAAVLSTAAAPAAFEDGAGVRNLTATANGTVNLYAVWQFDGYTITLNANGGTVAQSSASYDREAKAADLPVPTKSGAEFLGWYSAKTGGYRISREHLILANETYYARWSTSSTPSGSTYTIVFDVNGSATSVGSMTCTRDKVYKLPAVTLTPPVLTRGGGRGATRPTGWWCEETNRRYDPGMLFFNLVPVGSTATMTAVWE